jgi:hypothetical protein
MTSVKGTRRRRRGVGLAIGQRRQVDQNSPKAGAPRSGRGGESRAGPFKITVGLAEVADFKTAVTEGTAGPNV